MTTQPSPRAAAEAGKQARERKIQEAHQAHQYDAGMAYYALTLRSEDLTMDKVEEARLLRQACDEHLDELARLLAQRDGMDEAQSIGPDVALKGWGSKR